MLYERNEWVMDVTNDGEPHCFCPYDEGAIVVGLNYIADKAPGKLVGVFSNHGREHADRWVKEHPDWLEKYGKAA